MEIHPFSVCFSGFRFDAHQWPQCHRPALPLKWLLRNDTVRIPNSVWMYIPFKKKADNADAGLALATQATDGSLQAGVKPL